MADNDHRLLQQLHQYRQHIAGSAKRHAVTYVPGTWSNWLSSIGGAPQTSGSQMLHSCRRDLMLQIGDKSQSSISRSFLLERAKSARTDKDLYMLLVLTLIWGRGKANGRMKHHLLAALASEEVGCALSATVGLADPTEAYRTWSRQNVPGMGEAFFTKWLWVASAVRTGQAKLLVLDKRVWATLNAETYEDGGGGLGWSSVEAAGSRDRALRYQAYVDACHRWARSLGCTAEDIEYALFRANGNLANLEDRSNKSPTNGH